MIYSMTAFASLEIKKDWGNAVWEIRSVNQFRKHLTRNPASKTHSWQNRMYLAD